MTFDFRKWLTIQPNDEAYNFMDCTGKCAMGKAMAAHDEKWDISAYNAHIEREFGHERMDDYMALQRSKTFGELKRKLELV